MTKARLYPTQEGQKNAAGTAVARYQDIVWKLVPPVHRPTAATTYPIEKDLEEGLLGDGISQDQVLH